MQDIREIVMQSTDITPFQKRVYLALLDIPSGTTTTYGELARRILSAKYVCSKKRK